MAPEGDGDRNAGEGPRAKERTRNHKELNAELSASTPTPGSPVPGEGHLPLPKAEGHHGLEEGELASPPSSLNPLLSLTQGPLFPSLKAWRGGREVLPTGLPIGVRSLEPDCLGSNPDLAS